MPKYDSKAILMYLSYFYFSESLRAYSKHCTHLTFTSEYIIWSKFDLKLIKDIIRIMNTFFKEKLLYQAYLSMILLKHKLTHN